MGGESLEDKRRAAHVKITEKKIEKLESDHNANIDKKRGLIIERITEIVKAKVVAELKDKGQEKAPVPEDTVEAVTKEVMDELAKDTAGATNEEPELKKKIKKAVSEKVKNELAVNAKFDVEAENAGAVRKKRMDFVKEK